MDESAIASAVTALSGASATTVAWRSAGGLHLTVIAKATFSFALDSEMPRTEPQPILRAEVHHGNNPSRSVRFTTDLAPYLGRADVLFTGHAHAPAERATQSVPLRLALFDGRRPVLDKRLAAHEKAGFQRLPVVYERAWSGDGGQENPLGIAPGAGEANILDPAAPLRVAGFAPIARAWPARKRLLGATPRKQLEGPIGELPDAFDWSYFQAAPVDQRVPFLRGDEWIVLEGLSPAQPRLSMRLPRARGLARIHGLAAFGVSEGQPLELAADTLRIDGDEQRCTLVWRRSFPLATETALAAVRIVAGVETAGEALAWLEPSATVQAVVQAAVPASPPRAPQSTGHQVETVMLADDDEEAVTPRSVLPFRRETEPRAAPHAPAPMATFVLPPDAEAGGPPLPFAPSHSAEPRVAPAQPIAGAPWSRESAPRIVAPAFDAGTMMLAPDEPDLFSPAPLIAPALAPPSSSPSPLAPPSSSPSPLAAPAPPAAPAPDLPLASSPAGADEIDLERCAAIAAELAERAASRTEILAEHGLSETSWRAAEQRWNDAVEQETRRGARALRDRYDAAYVAAWEALRGPLDVADYARLVVADERGELSPRLDAMRLRRTVWTRMKRLWIKRLGDPSVAALVKREITKHKSA